MTNPILAPWTGAHGGHPSFVGVTAEQFEPALDEAMAAYRAEIAAIAGDPAPPTFANTLEALERAGEAYDRVTSLF
jgi:peptidyl-dipeptidase Dcp